MVSWQPFPNVVEQRSEHQQIGTLDTFCKLCGVCCGFPQVSVNGEPVIRVALWLSSHWRPFWKYALNERVLIEAFQHWNRTMALEEESHEFIDSSWGPAIRPVWHLVSEPLEGVATNSMA